MLERVHILIYCYFQFQFKMHCTDNFQHFQSKVTAWNIAFRRYSHKGNLTQQMTIPTHNAYISSDQMNLLCNSLQGIKKDVGSYCATPAVVSRNTFLQMCVPYTSQLVEAMGAARNQPQCGFPGLLWK